VNVWGKMGKVPPCRIQIGLIISCGVHSRIDDNLHTWLGISNFVIFHRILGERGLYYNCIGLG